MSDRHHPIVKTLLWPDETATQAFAAALARHGALANAFITLEGDLGAGKTTLVRHLLRALGVQGHIRSPSYAVVEPYTVGGLAVWHFDLYRFENPREWEEAGFRDIMASPGLKLLEWPAKAAGVLPRADLAVHLSCTLAQERRVTLTAQSACGAVLIAAAGATP